MKLGAFGIIRLGMQMLPEGAQFWMPMLITLGTINVIYGAISAMAQTDFKYMVGYSSVSHMGYVLHGPRDAEPDRRERRGAADVLARRDDGPHVRHGGRALRPGARPRDVALRRAGEQDAALRRVLRDRGAGVARAAGLSGFIAEFNVFVGVFQTTRRWAALAVLGAAITAVYILRMLALAFFGPHERTLGRPEGDDPPRAWRAARCSSVHAAHGRLPQPVHRPHLRVGQAASRG